jgi:hypothetical protein
VFIELIVLILKVASTYLQAPRIVERKHIGFHYGLFRQAKFMAFGVRVARVEDNACATWSQSAIGRRILPELLASPAVRAAEPYGGKSGRLAAVQLPALLSQGVGRFEPDGACMRSLADLALLADLVPIARYVHGLGASTIRAVICGFVANG